MKRIFYAALRGHNFLGTPVTWADGVVRWVDVEPKAYDDSDYNGWWMYGTGPRGTWHVIDRERWSLSGGVEGYSWAVPPGL